MWCHGTLSLRTSASSTEFFAGCEQIKKEQVEDCTGDFWSQVEIKICHFCLHLIGQQSVIWSQLTTRKFRNKSLPESRWGTLIEFERTESIVSAQHHIHMNTTQPMKAVLQKFKYFLWEVKEQIHYNGAALKKITVSCSFRELHTTYIYNVMSFYELNIPV